MTGLYEVLENVRGIDPIVVGLPDGNQALANKVGTVKLGLNIILRDVIFVPKSTCNIN